MKNETIKLTDFFKQINVEIPTTKKGEIHRGNLLKFFYEVSEKFPTGDNILYEYVDEVSQRGDGQGYETFWIFKRKSDDKYFYYYSYDGRVEYHELVETNKEVKTTWEFECQY